MICNKCIGQVSNGLCKHASTYKHWLNKHVAKKKHTFVKNLVLEIWVMWNHNNGIHLPSKMLADFYIRESYRYILSLLECVKVKCACSLQITVHHRTMANPNLPMSDEIATLENVWPVFLVATFDLLVGYPFECTFVLPQLQSSKLRLIQSPMEPKILVATMVTTFLCSDDR